MPGAGVGVAGSARLSEPLGVDEAAGAGDGVVVAGGVVVPAGAGAGLVVSGAAAGVVEGVAAGAGVPAAVFFFFFVLAVVVVPADVGAVVAVADLILGES